MDICVLGDKWRKDFTEDIISQLGLLVEYSPTTDVPLIVAASLSPGEAEKVKDAVSNGSSAVVLYPEKSLLSLFGDELPYTHSFPLMCLSNDNLPFSFLQVFPNISLIAPKEGEIWARYAIDFTLSNMNRTSRYPAVMWREYGKGRIGIFLYDLISTILLLQQGWEFFSSTGDFPPSSHPRVARSYHLGERLICPQLAHLPQAAFHELILLKLMRRLCLDIDPLPRLWSYPYPYTTALLLSGDSDDLPKNRLEAAWNKLSNWKAPYTQFIKLHDLEKFTAAELDERRKDNLDFGFHYYSAPMPSEDEMKKDLSMGRSLFEKKRLVFESVRGHSLIWIGWDEQVRLMAEAGTTLSSNIIFLWQWGTQQGLPYRLYTKQGRSPVFELPIYAEDDLSLMNKSGNVPLIPAEAAERMTSVINVMKNTYYQPVTCNFHPHYFTGTKPDSTEWLEAVVSHAHNQDIPVMNFSRFFTWWKKRSKTTGTCTISGDTVKCSVSPAGTELALAVPKQWNGKNYRGEGKELSGSDEILVHVKNAELNVETPLQFKKKNSPSCSEVILRY